MAGQIYQTHSAEETRQVAKKLAQQYQNGAILALSGELGAGKTTFVQGFAQGLGIKDKIISPTFILIRIHKVPKTDQKLYHIDLYRIEGAINTAALGLDEIFTNKSNIVLIEWAEKLGSKLPQAAIKININDLGRDKREIRVNS